MNGTGDQQDELRAAEPQAGEAPAAGTASASEPRATETENAPETAPVAGSAAPEDAVRTSSRPEPSASDSGWMTGLQSLMVTVVIAVFVITFIVQAFQIPSESMQNTLLVGDYLLVDKTHYGPGGHWGWLLPYRKVQRGDIVVFRYPVHPSQHFVKRVIGVSGDRIRMTHGRVFVNGQMLADPYVIHIRGSYESWRDNFPNGEYLSPSIDTNWYLQMHKLVEDGQLIVPSGCYFVLGDNRDDSLDSRYWGFVPQENVIGTPLLIYWSMQRPVMDGGDLEGQDGKLARLGRAVVAVFQNMRWKRMMRLVH